MFEFQHILLPWEEEPLSLSSSSESSLTPRKSTIFFWEKPKTHKNNHRHNATFIIACSKKSSKTKNKKRFRKRRESLTPHSLPSRSTLRAKPWSNRDPHHDWPHAFHVEAFVTFVAQEQLLRLLAGATLLAHEVAVILALHHRVLRPRHYIRHRPVLLRRRWVPSGTPRVARRMRAAAEADLSLSRRRWCRWSHVVAKGIGNWKFREQTFFSELSMEKDENGVNSVENGEKK